MQLKNYLIQTPGALKLLQEAKVIAKITSSGMGGTYIKLPNQASQKTIKSRLERNALDRKRLLQNAKSTNKAPEAFTIKEIGSKIGSIDYNKRKQDSKYENKFTNNPKIQNN
jgi:mevalonate kinase